MAGAAQRASAGEIFEARWQQLEADADRRAEELERDPDLTPAAKRGRVQDARDRAQEHMRELRASYASQRAQLATEARRRIFPGAPSHPQQLDPRTG